MRLLVAISMLIAGTALAADTIGKQQVRTSLKNDLQTQLTDQAGSTLANIEANNSAPGGVGTGGIQVLEGNVQSSAPTYASGNIAMPWLDTSGRMQVVSTQAAATFYKVDLEQVLGATISASNPAFVQISNGTSAYTSGQTTMANSFPVVIASDQSTLKTLITQAVPTGTSFNKGAALTINGGSTGAVVCKSGLAVSQPTKPFVVTVTGFASARCTLRFNDNGVFTNFADLGTTVASPTATWTPPQNFVSYTTSATVTTLQYEANCSNVDANNTDFTCSIIYCQAASGC